MKCDMTAEHRVFPKAILNWLVVEWILGRGPIPGDGLKRKCRVKGRTVVLGHAATLPALIKFGVQKNGRCFVEINGSLLEGEVPG